MLKKSGMLWWRKTWYSYCSAHQHPDSNCDNCNSGHYKNDIMVSIGHYFYKHHYKWWYWWVNRTNNTTRKKIERDFPSKETKDPC